MIVVVVEVVFVEVVVRRFKSIKCKPVFVATYRRARINARR